MNIGVPTTSVSMSLGWATATHPASPGDPPRPADRSGWGSYEITAFALGPGVCQILCVLFKSEVSISPNPVKLL